MPNEQEHTAKAIAEELLEITGNALICGDFDAFAAMFHLPNTMTTASGAVVVSDTAHLRTVFDAVRDRMKCGGVKELVRYIDAAEFRSPTQIASTHVSHAIATGDRLQEPYPVFSIIERIDGAWKCVSSDYGVKPRSPQENAILHSLPPSPDTEPGHA